MKVGNGWKIEDGEYVRGDSDPVNEVDVQVFKAEIERINAKSVLEFGPGESTQIFLDLGIQRIVTCEHKDRWLKVAQERFAEDGRVKVLRYTDTDPVDVPDLGGEKFDLALVDSPQGFFPMRKAVPGMEDCNRLNTCLFALKHAKVVLLHDASRPLERGSLGRLNKAGYKWEYISISDICAIARIESLELHDNRPHSQDAPQSGGAPTRSKPKRRRSSVSRGAGGLSVRRPENPEHSRRASDNLGNGSDSDRDADSPRPHRRKRSEKRVRSDQRDGAIHPVTVGGEGTSRSA